MRSLLASNWPVSYMEQALFVQKIEAELERLEAAQRSIVVYQATRPTQKEWEQAYVVQSGKSLPITPGSRLLWWDWRSGRVKMHTTAYDLEIGTESSGTVYEWSSIKREQGPYRFIGAASGSGDVRNAQFKQVGVSQASYNSIPLGSIVLSPEFQMKQKVRAIELFFNIKFNSTAELTLQLRQARAYENQEPFGSTIVNNVFDEAVQTGPSFTRAARTHVVNDYDIELFDVAAAAQDADQRLFGKVVVYNVADVTDDDGHNEVVNIGNMAYRFEAYSFPSTGAADYKYWHGGGINRGSYPISEGLKLSMLGTSSVPQQSPDSRIWAYAWFDTDYTVNISPLGGFHDVS